VPVGNNKRYFFVIRLRASMLGGGAAGGRVGNFQGFSYSSKDGYGTSGRCDSVHIGDIA